MSKRRHAQVDLADFKERKADEGSVDVKLSDGTRMRIPPPELWPDVVIERIQAERAGGDAYPLERMARDMVGDEPFDMFVADGGTTTLFHAILADSHQLDVGESSASS